MCDKFPKTPIKTHLWPTVYFAWPILLFCLFCFGLNLHTFAIATSKIHATVELTVHFLCYHWSLFSVRFLSSYFVQRLNWMFVIWRRFVLTWHLDLITVIDLNCVMTFESFSSCSFFLFHYYYFYIFFLLCFLYSSFGHSFYLFLHLIAL